MHGRLKVRTSAEENERKKVERALKVKAYKAATSKINVKRKLQEFDDELLQMTTPILQRNPDVATLWNIRRQCIEQKVQALADNQDAQQDVYNAELNFTENCLLANPKSYCSWHQRCWILEKSPQANWQREVQLCTKYLKLDERNFHTWDYRRYVLAKAGISPQHEIEFCTEKIKSNFSNYSAWHQRSLLLPILFPFEGESLPKRPLSEEKLKEELEMVLTAAFTDPNDSSAWFYQRWLLGSSRAALNVAAFRCDQTKAVLVFTQPIALTNTQIKVYNNVDETVLLELTDWNSCNGAQTDMIWITSVPERFKCSHPNTACYLTVDISSKQFSKLELKTFDDGLYYFLPPNDSMAFSSVVLDELKIQLKSCEDLLTYEPESKWTLLTTALLMHAIEAQQYNEQSLAHLQTLIRVDSLRQGYYEDLAAKWILEKELKNWFTSSQIPNTIDLRHLTQLTSLPYAPYLSISNDVLLPPNLQNKYNLTNKLLTFSTLQPKNLA